MKNSIFFKNFLVTVCMFAVSFLVFGVSMLIVGRGFLVREQEDSLYASADEVQLLAEAVHKQGALNGLELRMSLAAIAHCNGTHIFLCDEDGTVVNSSDTARISPYIGTVLSQSVLDRVGTNESFEELGTLDGFYENAHYVVAKSIGSSEGFVFVTHEAGGFMRVWSGFVTMFILAAVGVLAIATAFQFYYSRSLAKPLHEMSEAANRFARGDYSARISPYNEQNEIGTLTVAFNAMAESLSQNEARRREFVANVSHELRTPMTTISGFADGILDGTIPPEKERKYLAKISAETKRLSRLVRSMLDMSRLQDGDNELRNRRFNLNEMVVQTVLNFEDRVTEKKLNVSLDMPEDELYVLGDVDALTRVVYNLVDNAVKFAYDGTDLSVSVWKENGKAYTCVQDVGAEIPRSELPLIFDRFHKSDRSRSMDRDGVGLGLYMVRQIIAAHDQDIYVTSEKGVTAFTFTLKLADEP